MHANTHVSFCKEFLELAALPGSMKELCMGTLWPSKSAGTTWRSSYNWTFNSSGNVSWSRARVMHRLGVLEQGTLARSGVLLVLRKHCGQA